MLNTKTNFYQQWQLIYHRRNDVRVYTNTALVLLGLAFLIIVAIQPTLQTIINLEKDIKTKQSLLKQMDLKIKRLNKLQDEYLEINDKLNLEKNVFLSNPSSALLGRIVKVTAKKNNLILTNLNLSPYQWPPSTIKNKRKKNNNFIYYQAEASLNGKYNDILNFFKDIETSQAMIKISSFNMKENKGLLQVNVSLVLEARNDKTKI